MAQLYEILKPESKYYDWINFKTQQQYNQALRVSATVYVGNLSFYTTQDSIYELFSRAGRVEKIIMGIDDEGNTCGFCFVVYENHEYAGRAIQFISKSKLNDRIIRVDWDPGYREGREKGRGSHGRQRRDQFRSKQDSDRPVRDKFERRGGDRRGGDRRGGDRRGGYRDRGQWGDKRERQYNNTDGYSSRKKYPPRDTQRPNEYSNKQDRRQQDRRQQDRRQQDRQQEY